MKLNRITTLQQIQKEFQSQFPGLKLDFYKQPHYSNQGSPKEDLILDQQQNLGSISPSLVEDEIEFSSDLTVSELENQFETRFSLNVQVSRLSNDLWLQTTATDDWTLAEQNRKGLNSNNI